MDTTLTFLIYIGIIILIGIISSMISHKLKIPNILLLLIIGIILGTIQHNSSPLITFPYEFLRILGIFALAMITFDFWSRIKHKEFTCLTNLAIKQTIISFILNIIILTAAAKFILKIDITLALLLSIIITSISKHELKHLKTRLLNFLKEEALICTPVALTLPFIIITIPQTGLYTTLETLSLQLIFGIGAGIIIGIILFNVMKRCYSSHMSPLLLMSIIIISYMFSKTIGGNEILTVATLGILFGNIYVKEKTELHEFSDTLSTALIILVITIAGIITHLQLTPTLLFNSFLLFGIYIILRFISLNISLYKKKYSLKDKLRLTLITPKGLAVATVILGLSIFAFNIQNISIILHTTILIMIYSLLTTLIVSKVK